MLHKAQRLTNRIVQPCSFRWRLYGREPCGISRSRSTILRFQGLLIFSQTALERVARGAIQSMQKAAETLTDGC